MSATLVCEECGAEKVLVDLAYISGGLVCDECIEEIWEGPGHPLRVVLPGGAIWDTDTPEEAHHV